MKETKTAYSYLIRHMDAPSFNKVRDLAFDFVKKLPQELCDELHNLLNRGVNVLDSEPLLQMYFYSFGNMHVEKLNLAFDNIHYCVKNANQIELIDYGCGQGLATMCYHDYFEKVNPNQEVTKITLIEPSTIALARAELLCETFFPTAQIYAIEKKIDELEANDITTSKEILTVHLFSNILDVETFNIDKFANIVKISSKGKNEYVIVSPLQNSRRILRLKQFALTLENNLYFEKYYKSREFNKDKDWTCAIILCSSSKDYDTLLENFDDIYFEAFSLLKNKEQNTNRGKELFHILSIGALSGNKKCQNGLGAFYNAGFCCDKNYSKAFEWFNKSANQGFPPAIANIAKYYYLGKYVNLNYPKAAELYKKACDLNYIPAYSHLGICYMFGKGVAQNIEQAIELFKSAASLNDPLAMRLLGCIYLKGRGVLKDIDTGLTLLKLAADHGDKIACRNLGNYFQKDHKDETNISQAIKFYTMAGELGDTKSIEILLELFEKKDYKKFFNDIQFDLLLKLQK